MGMTLKEDLQKLQFYMVEHEEEIKKFWNIVSVLAGKKELRKGFETSPKHSLETNRKS